MEGTNQAKMYIHESIREDTHQLYGFTTKKGRELFRLLIAVSGVGPGIARQILSALGCNRLEECIVSGNDKILREVKGIGSKTAQRIIIDLKDKIKPGEITLSSQPIASTETFEESMAALIMLGYKPNDSRKALTMIFKEQPTINTETAIRKALKLL
jgi:Holliday junction DNA helicase RuvA